MQMFFLLHYSNNKETSQKLLYLPDKSEHTIWKTAGIRNLHLHG
jgi:hypothetical protein